MANSTKIAIVGLMILLVVVVAQYVKNDTPINESTSGDSGGEVAAGEGEKSASSTKSTQPPSRTNRVTATRGSTATPGGTGARLASNSRNGGTSSVRGGSISGPPRNPVFTPITSPSSSALASSNVGNRLVGRHVGLFPAPGDDRMAGTRRPLVETEMTKNGTRVVSRTGSGTSSVPPPISNTGLQRRQEEARRRGSTLAGAGTGRSDTSTPGTSIFPPKKIGASKPVTVASSTPLTKPAPGSVRGFPKKHKLAQNESPWGLSRQYYGSGLYFEVIQAANKGSRFLEGQTVTIPAPPTAARKEAIAQEALARAKSKTRTSLNPGASTKGGARVAKAGRLVAKGGYQLHKVRRGETLNGIAKRYYGSTRFGYLIENANGSLKYTVLQADSTIRIPPKP